MPPLAPLAAVRPPPRLASQVWQADQLARSDSRVWPSGYALLDAELPEHEGVRGWPTGGLIELLQAQAGLAEWRLLLPLLQALMKDKNQGLSFGSVESAPLLLINPPHLPYARALSELGIPASRLLMVKAATPAERLWAVEQALRCPSLSVLLCWLPQARPEQLRRLQLAAKACRYPVFIFRPLAAQYESSPAPLRLTLTSRNTHQLEIEIVKRKGPALAHKLLLQAVPQSLSALLGMLTHKAQITLEAQVAMSKIVQVRKFDQPDQADRFNLSGSANRPGRNPPSSLSNKTPSHALDCSLTSLLPSTLTQV